MQSRMRWHRSILALTPQGRGTFDASLDYGTKVVGIAW